ncbi:MAG: ankyrin repeat domain-containing protein [Verrucomicrobiota bacterium]
MYLIGGGTPLHFAAWKGNFEVVKVLLRHGAPLDVQANKPPEGVPLGWAAHGSKNCANPNGDYTGVVQALLKAGAQPKSDMLNEASEEVKSVLQPLLD